MVIVRRHADSQFAKLDVVELAIFAAIDASTTTIVIQISNQRKGHR